MHFFIYTCVCVCDHRHHLLHHEIREQHASAVNDMDLHRHRTLGCLTRLLKHIEMRSYTVLPTYIHLDKSQHKHLPFFFFTEATGLKLSHCLKRQVRIPYLFSFLLVSACMSTTPVCLIHMVDRLDSMFKRRGLMQLATLWLPCIVAKLKHLMHLLCRNKAQSRRNVTRSGYVVRALGLDRKLVGSSACLKGSVALPLGSPASPRKA